MNKFFGSLVLFILFAYALYNGNYIISGIFLIFLLAVLYKEM